MKTETVIMWKKYRFVDDDIIVVNSKEQVQERLIHSKLILKSIDKNTIITCYLP